MIIQLQKSILANQKDYIVSKISGLGYKATEVNTQMGTYLIAMGKKEFDIRQLGSLPGISDIHQVSDDYQLVSRKWKVDRTAIDLGDGVHIGNASLFQLSMDPP